ncbi:hypothetical protein AAG570_010646 [Ranatra chinensis]|uniref:NADH dehydrogenase [ubiquinone] 1 alpha subcomplex subunit 12 n=1 Tax=Ranatra chinensis TaxID=642074 RepID=A0ABD0YQB9_9HEMI
MSKRVRNFLSIHNFFSTDSLKFGRFVGEDGYGNKYYENPYYFFGTDRWVIYNPRVGLNYDGSQIPAQWFGWMHHTTDQVPCEKDFTCHRWMSDHTPNMTGTPMQYVPYSTVKEKSIAWDPKQVRLIKPSSPKKKKKDCI